MPDLTQAVRVSELALEPYRMRIAPIAGATGRAPTGSDPRCR